MKTSKIIAEEIVGMLDDKKAADVVILDISRLTVIADYFVIGSGRTESQVKGLYDEVNKRMSDKGIEPRHIDGGRRDGRWIVLDYGDVIVHLFHKEEREFYNIERLWADAEKRSISSGQDE
ncbi:MAG TPA: ribosome silencing factor [Bacillota bacterium]|nr:ribosome silencing factor [Bacillota bacterium]